MVRALTEWWERPPRDAVAWLARVLVELVAILVMWWLVWLTWDAPRGYFPYLAI